MVYHNILVLLSGYPMFPRHITQFAACLVVIVTTTLSVSAVASPIVATTIKPLLEDLLEVPLLHLLHLFCGRPGARTLSQYLRRLEKYFVFPFPKF